MLFGSLDLPMICLILFFIEVVTIILMNIISKIKNVLISNKILLKCALQYLFDDRSTLFQLLAWHGICDWPIPETMLTNSPENDVCFNPCFNPCLLLLSWTL